MLSTLIWWPVNFDVGCLARDELQNICKLGIFEEKFLEKWLSFFISFQVDYSYDNNMM